VTVENLSPATQEDLPAVAREGNPRLRSEQRGKRTRRRIRQELRTGRCLERGGRKDDAATRDASGENGLRTSTTSTRESSKQRSGSGSGNNARERGRPSLSGHEKTVLSRRDASPRHGRSRAPAAGLRDEESRGIR
jgi:hypothetical protein